LDFHYSQLHGGLVAALKKESFVPVQTSITDCDTNAANNSPQGGETAKGNIDNYLRQAFAFIRQLSDSIATNAAAATAAANAAKFPAGTRMPFNQTAAPTGWTKDVTAALNDSILRIVIGTVGAGGSTAFSTFNGQSATAATTLTSGQMPVHAHSVNDPGHAHNNTSGDAGSGPYLGSGNGGSLESRTGISSATTGISLNNAGSGGSHSHSMTTNIKYNDFIIATKD
jgi:hypothetical protein